MPVAKEIVKKCSTKISPASFFAPPVDDDVGINSTSTKLKSSTKLKYSTTSKILTNTSTPFGVLNNKLETSNWRKVVFHSGHYVFIYSAFFDDRLSTNVIRLNIVAPLRYTKNHGRTRFGLFVDKNINIMSK